MFVVSYREIGATSWIAMDRNFTADPADNTLLVWSANVMHQMFQESVIEFQVKVVNSHSYVSNCAEQMEELGKYY